MVAQVIVNSLSRQTDKEFDYLIPEELSDNIIVGMRVLVPFGASNKTIDGYVVGIKSVSLSKNLKKIQGFLEGRVFDEKMLDIIFYMREKYLCTYIEAIKTIVPSGTNVKILEFYEIVDYFDDLYGHELEIYNLIKNSGKALSKNEIVKIFPNTKTQTTLKKMCDKHILKRKFEETTAVSDKYIRIVKISDSVSDINSLIDELNKKRSYVSAKVIKTLRDADILSFADLKAFAGCSAQTINSLKKRGLVEFEEVEVLRTHKRLGKTLKDTPPILTMEQESVCKKIRNSLKNDGFIEYLLHGVTGSGKTEVYMNAIDAVISKGKKAIVLVPEISLTPQMMNRFIRRFGERVSVYHSGLSQGERYDEWKKMRDNKADVVIGARSAIFAPFDNIGIIIMDEEHESTYKSEMTPRYDTKEIALFRASQHNSCLIYASATPDVRTYYKAKTKKINLLELKTRVNKNPIPKVSIIDMRSELKNGNKTIFSNKLIEEIELNLKRKEQTILFLNRRGFSTFVSCRSCGFVATCPNCNISMTYHKFNDSLKCHYCGYSRKNYVKCPVCHSSYIRYFGGGTQKVEEEIKKIFPSISTIRMDVDTTTKQNSHEKILHEFEEKKIDVLIGTQMVAKGLDFPNVTLVGVISADTMLNIDDYRSGERSFDLLEQVTGRAGRAEKKGRAIIQTYSPEHNAVIYAKEHNYIDFYNQEIASRETLWYPPFSQMISVLFSGTLEDDVSKCAKAFSKYIAGRKAEFSKVQLLGPTPATITKIKNKYRWRLLIKCENSDLLTKALVDARIKASQNKNYKDVSIVIDKNPNNIY